jgi:outer membrane autotransporter protein
VQHTIRGLSIGVFGATGYSSASFSSSSLKGDSFHGGLYAHVEAGMPFFDVSWFAGSIDQTAARSITAGSYSASANSKFQSSEYAVHLRGGLNIPKVAGSYLVTPSLALLCNGYSQNGVSESTADGAALTTDRVSKSAWQSRLGSEISRSFKAGTKPANLLASAYWIHDFDRAARSARALQNPLARGQGRGGRPVERARRLPRGPAPVPLQDAEQGVLALYEDAARRRERRAI